MADRYLAMVYLDATTGDELLDWWQSRGRFAMAELPGAGSLRLCEVIAGHPSHMVLGDWEDVSSLSIHALLGATSDQGMWQTLEPWQDREGAGAALLCREFFPNRETDDPEVSTLSPGQHLFIALANIDAEVEEGFNRWYSERHIPDVDTAGLRNARRFLTFSAAHKYVATYHIDGPEVMDSEALGKVRGFDEYTGRAHGLTRHVLRVLA